MSTFFIAIEDKLRNPLLNEENKATNKIQLKHLLMIQLMQLLSFPLVIEGEPKPRSKTLKAFRYSPIYLTIFPFQVFLQLRDLTLD